LYDRFDQQGRMMPEGLTYIDSWIDQDVSRCYQVMETDNFDLFQLWIEQWNDLTDFEVIPVISSAQAKEKLTGKL
jgi:hypothetical protein